ncbi:MAG: PadR family transcriptional regulator [Actinomycetota bacterium]|nr:PadR family transcriptional regulator [Actinomycetota bacterium]
MREPTWLVLTALAGAGRLHGYGITGEVERLSEGRLRLRAGTLYAALDRLAGEGLVATAGEEVVDGRLRRYYALTTEGRRALEAEARARARISAVALGRLGLAGAPQ